MWRCIFLKLSLCSFCENQALLWIEGQPKISVLCPGQGSASALDPGSYIVVNLGATGVVLQEPLFSKSRSQNVPVTVAGHWLQTPSFKIFKDCPPSTTASEWKSSAMCIPHTVLLMQGWVSRNLLNIMKKSIIQRAWEIKCGGSLFSLFTRGTVHY